jgi:hypothetical protein
VLRLPGTLNWKYDPPRLCRTIQADWARRYSLADFAQFAVDSRGHGDGKGATEDGTPIPKGSRRPTFVKMAGAMRRQGATAPEIEAALLVMNQRCAPPLTAKQVHDVAYGIAGTVCASR